MWYNVGWHSVIERWAVILHKKYLKSFTGRLVITAVFAVLQIIAFIASIVWLGSYTIASNIIL